MNFYHLKHPSEKNREEPCCTFSFNVCMGFLRTLLDVRSGLSLSHHSGSKRTGESPCNKNSPHTTQTSTLARLPTHDLGEEGEEGQGRCDDDKAMRWDSKLTGGSCVGLALPDQRRQASTQGTPPCLSFTSLKSLVKAQLHRPY